ncbi:MAG: DUF6908 domain-containing protein [Halodesulfurarchaeum sp.]
MSTVREFISEDGTNLSREEYVNAAKRILERMGVESPAGLDINESYTIEVPGFHDLTIERVGSDEISVAHHYVKRGDLMCDPEIVFRVKDDDWTPIEYTQHPHVYEYDESGLDLDGFVVTWSRNLVRQGFLRAADRVGPGGN